MKDAAGPRGKWIVAHKLLSSWTTNKTGMRSLAFLCHIVVATPGCEEKRDLFMMFMMFMMTKNFYYMSIGMNQNQVSQYLDGYHLVI